LNEVITVPKMSNREFLEKYARSGRVGLVGGTTLIEKAIRRAERHVDENEQWSLWSHAMLFEGKRVDGHHWVIESDLQIHRKHIQLGVQENRIAKYYKEEMYPHLAVLDFALSDAQVAAVLSEGLRMVALHAVYSLRELIGAAFALRHARFRPRRNLLARRKSMYCSGFVQYVFTRAGIDLAPGVHASHGTPEDISRTPVPHTTYLLQRV
jgi:dihydropteroate synthase